MDKLLYRFFSLRFLKRSCFGLHHTGGRNFLGRVCVHHKGGGLKRRFLLLDRYRRLGQYGYVVKIFRGTFKSPFFGLILYDNGLVSPVTLVTGISAGWRLFSGAFFLKENGGPLFSAEGSSSLVRNIGLFTVISSLELYPWSGFKVARASGSSAYLVGKPQGKAIIKLSSGWQIKVPSDSMAVLGMHSNFSRIWSSVGKAGKQRALGVRPTVRGVIKNPCDHPHGGGEGRGSPPVAAVTPWGFFTKGTPTKNRKVDRLRRRLFKALV